MTVTRNSRQLPLIVTERMEPRPRPPLRLSVDERVEYAVQEAVRGALGEQRKTQEKELDALSDALQRCGTA